MHNEKETTRLYKISDGSFPDILVPHRQVICNLNTRFKRNETLLDMQTSGKNLLSLIEKHLTTVSQVIV
jgi:hypothetical protein